MMPAGKGALESFSASLSSFGSTASASAKVVCI
jgi:hypothetical protein